MKQYEATFDSLYGHEYPEWYRDAKLGFWSHWGLQSVPMTGDWYARNMYIEGTRQSLVHRSRYGHPSVFGYKDLIPLWKAERFDPMALMERYAAAGGRYFMAQASHHDHFFNYDTAHSRFNSVQMGPHKDICALWKQAADAHGLRFGISEHIAGSWTWTAVNKGHDTQGPYKDVPYDGRDPAYKDLYLDNYEHYYPDDPTRIDPWMTANKAWHAHWYTMVREMIDRFSPELFYSDNPLAFQDKGYDMGLAATAYLYNRSIERNGENEAVYFIKEKRAPLYRVGVRDVEKSSLAGIAPWPWQIDTSLADWFYDEEHPYKDPGHVIEILVDSIAKNGGLMINVPQRPDGTIDETCGWVLDEITHYTKTCGEGIFGTRPYRVYGEGTSGPTTAAYCEDRVNWTEMDTRFTQKDGTLYVHMMRTPERRILTVRALAAGEKVRRARLLGGSGTLDFEQRLDGISIRLPEEMPTRYINCVALEMEK